MFVQASETLAFLCTPSESVTEDIFLFTAMFLLLNGESQSLFRIQYGKVLLSADLLTCGDITSTVVSYPWT